MSLHLAAGMALFFALGVIGLGTLLPFLSALAVMLVAAHRGGVAW